MAAEDRSAADQVEREEEASLRVRRHGAPAQTSVQWRNACAPGVIEAFPLNVL